jgi:hypothetical protein
MFRQPFSAAAIPFKDNRISGNTSINAVDYDLGRNGVAYFDKDTANYRTSGQPGVGNRGRVYRNDGVDIRKDSAAENSYYVSDMETGEWLQYTIHVNRKGTYALQLLVSAEQAGSVISVKFANSKSAKKVSIPSTGANANWEKVEIKNISLPAGRQPLKIVVDAGVCNLKALKFVLQK